MPPDVQVQTSAIASGDAEAFSRFYRRWFDALYADARRVTGRDESFCLDVVHEAMLRVVRSIKPMPSEADLRRWLSVVVRSCAFDRLRVEARETRRRRRAAEHPVPETGTGDDEEARRRLQWLEEQLATLDDRSAQLLLMRHRFGWTLERIERVLGLGPSAVDGRLRRLTALLSHRAKKEGMK